MSRTKTDNKEQNKTSRCRSKKSAETKNNVDIDGKRKFALMFCGAIIGFLNGFFGGGGGMVCVPLLQKVLMLDAKHSHATAILVIFPLSLISAAIYIFNGFIDSFPLLTVGLGVVVGGVIGAFALKFLPPKILRLIFAIIMFIGGIKLIL